MTDRPFIVNHTARPLSEEAFAVTRRAAEQAAGRGVDAVIAQGSEAGGFGGDVAALALVPHVVDAVEPVPVVAT